MAAMAASGTLYRANAPEGPVNFGETPKVFTFFARVGKGRLQLIEWIGQYEYRFREPGHPWPDEEPDAKQEGFKQRLCLKGC